jgi:hypothetical protein
LTPLSNNSDNDKKDKAIEISIPERNNIFAMLSVLAKRGEITPAENQAAATVFKKSDKPLI